MILQIRGAVEPAGVALAVRVWAFVLRGGFMEFFGMSVQPADPAEAGEVFAAGVGAAVGTGVFVGVSPAGKDD